MRHTWNTDRNMEKYVHSIKVREVCEKGNATHRVAARNLVLGDTLVTHCEQRIDHTDVLGYSPNVDNQR